MHSGVMWKKGFIMGKAEIVVNTQADVRSQVVR